MAVTNIARNLFMEVRFTTPEGKMPVPMLQMNSCKALAFSRKTGSASPCHSATS
eukprot:CAMPEP_0180656136 /NCGR_PEP_ID=MMETSP1037_2-20121125/55679_1 /TAXON_ID=632150 /ORGANISM="Azadinium spinosum, Strain 3D9" /LENGTH=53 /DNA_ID=CAMNT_0022682675 /DNA_START=68 /DNA_END=225 /DNA_ORIENTATION=-